MSGTDNKATVRLKDNPQWRIGAFTVELTDENTYTDDVYPDAYSVGLAGLLEETMTYIHESDAFLVKECNGDLTKLTDLMFEWGPSATNFSSRSSTRRSRPREDRSRKTSWTRSARASGSPDDDSSDAGM